MKRDFLSGTYHENIVHGSQGKFYYRKEKPHNQTPPWVRNHNLNFMSWGQHMAGSQLTSNHEYLLIQLCWILLQGYGYNLDWRGWGTSEYRFTPNRPSHWSLISTGEGILTGSKHNTLDPVNIPSPVEIRDQWNGLFGAQQYSEVPHPLQSRL